MKTLTSEQRRKWAIDGYIHLEQVLPPDEVEFFSQKLDELRGQPGYEPMESPMGHYGWVGHCVDLDLDGFMDRRDLLPYHDAFIQLIDRPGVFDLIVDIMGPYILFSMSQAIVRPSSEEFPGYTHTDGGEALAQIRVTETSRPLAMKAMYLLTDVTEPDRTRQSDRIPRQSHAAVSSRSAPPRDARFPRRCPAARQGGRLFPVSPCLVARPGAKFLGPRPKNLPLQLLPDVRSRLRLRNHPGDSRSMHAKTKAAPG